MVQGSSPREPLGEHDLSLLSAYLDDELSDAERARLEARLGADAALQAELEALRRTVALVRSLPEVPVPRNFTLDPAQYGRRRTGGWRFSLATPMLAAGASLLVVAVCAGVLLTVGGLGRQVAPAFAPVAGEAESVAEADFAAEEAAPEEEAARAFEMAEEEPAAEEEEFFAEEAEEVEEEAAPALEVPAPAEDRVEGAEAGADALGEAEGELPAVESEPLSEEPAEEEPLAQEVPAEQEAPAEAEAPVEEAEANGDARQPTAAATGTPVPQATAAPPAGTPEAPEVSELPEPGPADEAGAAPVEPAAKVDDTGELAQGVPERAVPQAYAPPRPSRAIPWLIGAVIVLGAALLVAGIALTLAKRRR